MQPGLLFNEAEAENGISGRCAVIYVFLAIQLEHWDAGNSRPLATSNSMQFYTRTTEAERVRGLATLNLDIGTYSKFKTAFLISSP